MKHFFTLLLTVFSGPLAILLASALRKDPERKRQDAIMAIGFVCYIMLGMQVLGHMPSRTFDVLYLSIDRGLGFNTLGFFHWVVSHYYLGWFLLFGYMALPFVITVVWLLEGDLQMRRAILIGGLCCFLFYFIGPAVGPLYFDFAHNVVQPGAPDNCMPSMHLTWALLLALNARAKWLQRVLWAYVALIAVATVGLGEHYLIDLIAALPYTAAVEMAAFEVGRVRRLRTATV